MTATVDPAGTGPGDPGDPRDPGDARDSGGGLPARLALERTTSARRIWTNRMATASMLAAVLAAVIPLGLVLGFVVKEGATGISWSMLTQPIPTIRSRGAGIGPAIAGTIVITLVATVLAVPLGILAAVYLNELGRDTRTAGVIRFLANVMTGVPSIVMGLFVYTVWVLRFRSQTGFAGSLALACLMLPIVIRSTEEMLRLVPGSLREASLALGASRSRTVLSVVLPAALPGITSGVLLAVARAAGETAPLLFTIGFATDPNWNPFRGTNVTLSQLIFSNATAPFPGARERAWVAAFTLIALVLVLTVVARFVSSRFTRR
jgi:phosphate transport system permease protein